MKIEYIYTCCRCGKEFKGNAKLFGTAKVNVAKVDKTYYQTNAEYDYEEICPECFKELKHWLKGNSTSMDEIKRLHTDMEELKRQLDVSKEMITNRDKEILKLKGEIVSLNDRCSWFLEEVDTPRGKCIRSKDWRTVEKAAEIIKALLLCLRDFDEDTIFQYKQCIEKAEKFLEDYNLNKERISND